MTARAENTVKNGGHLACTPGAPPVHRRIAAFAIAAALAGCAAEPPAPELVIGLRNPTVAFGGTSRFSAERFAGAWETVACLGSCVKSERYVQATEGVYLRRTGDVETPFLISAPGVLREMGGDDRLVVMWVDEGFRTAAIGDADGRWAAILNRNRKPARDRIKAATEILDFNGWDVSKLRVVK
ncbi:lipocalin [Sulfitobacter geojensis]|uniref:lipocalin n=1 Tax=Sulfitobacter geojensis TaxID=1342299 RepID=UPI00193C78D5|nr:lipocalin [Sulfitobacter geojensis]MBM1761929.1 lipocalin [Sulfitobacter geojensis]MBM1777361.1 lipocalin [Sulfitobacter geojensis]MBM1827565.1 lipocalin [Sulfitobacter geojensis]